MNRSASLIFRSTRLPYQCRQLLPIRTYVNWTPDKSSNNKKSKLPSSSPSARKSPPSGDPQSPAELDKAFQPQSPPPNTGPIPSSEPQLLRLKKSPKEWEEAWSERVWRTGQVTLVVSMFIVGYAIWADYIHLPYGMNYRPSKLPEPGSEEEAQYLKRIEKTLHSLPIVQKLSENPDFVKTVGIFTVPAADLPHNLTLGTLAGTGRITVKPVTFYNDKTKEFVVVMHVGQDVCGHRGLVHGGFLATILDECLGKTAITTLSKEYDAKGKKRQVWPEDRIIVTANLNINYRVPTKVNQFLLIKSVLTESTERKAKAKGHIETIDEIPVLLCEGEGLFVKPRKEAVKKIISK